MKIAITGHASGIGYETFNLLQHTHECVGFDKENGHNICDDVFVDQITDDFDCFVNNAYHQSYQERILLQLYNRWRDTNKIIVNIGSMVSVYPQSFELINELHGTWSQKYMEDKISFMQTHRRLSYECWINKYNVQLKMLFPGATDTALLKDLDIEKAHPKKVALAIKQLIDQTDYQELVVW